MPAFAAELVAHPEVSESEREVSELRAVALGRLTGHFTHELRNVLTGVRCYLELLRGLKMPDEYGGFLVEVQGGLDRMTDLATLWHDVARSRCSTSHCNAEVKRLMQLLMVAGVNKTIELKEDLDPEASGVQVDASALEAVLLALLDDLVARSPASLEVRTIRRADQVRIRLSAERPKVAPELHLDSDRLATLLGQPILRIPGDAICYELRLTAETA